MYFVWTCRSQFWPGKFLSWGICMFLLHFVLFYWTHESTCQSNFYCITKWRPSFLRGFSAPCCTQAWWQANKCFFFFSKLKTRKGSIQMLKLLLHIFNVQRKVLIIYCNPSRQPGCWFVYSMEMSCLNSSWQQYFIKTRRFFLTLLSWKPCSVTSGRRVVVAALYAHTGAHLQSKVAGCICERRRRWWVLDASWRCPGSCERRREWIQFCHQQICGRHHEEDER